MLVTVTSHKGGVGKTTSALHLAAVLAEHYGSERVALVDTDPNESALDHASRGKEVWGYRRLPFSVLGPEDEIEQEHVVFDSQGRLSGEDLEAALEGSDLLVAPTMPDYPEIKALARFAADVEEASQELRSGSGGVREPVEPAPYRVLLTMVPWYERLHSPGRSELEKSGVPLFKGQIEARKAFKHAAAMGVPVYEVKGGAAKRGWEDYVRVGKELIGELERVAS